jgi:hypothetical protein
MTDNQELNGDQCQKDYEPNDVIAAYYELTEGFDYFSCSPCALIAMEQDAASAGQVKR